MSNNQKDLADQILKLKHQLKQLQDELDQNSNFKSSKVGQKKAENGENRKKSVQKGYKNPNKRQKKDKNGEKWQKKETKIVEGEIDETLNFKSKNGDVIKLNEKDVVDNQVIMGDEVILEFKGGNIDKFKVARRAKREVIEALVTQKDNILYAVSQHGVHKLLDYDIKTKGVLKGFEVNLLAPKEKGEQAKVCVVKDIESSGNYSVPKKEGAVEIKKALNYDPRVLGDDDLV